MPQVDLEQLKFPVGKFVRPSEFEEHYIISWIKTIELLPQQVINLVDGLSSEKLEWNYRPNGWNIRQVVHHLADSHINALIRFKLALTEHVPTIKPYEQDLWVQLADAQELDLQASLQILKGLHHRWTILLKSLTQTDWNLQYIHPDHKGNFTLFATLAMYDWHSRHHLAHVQQALKNEGSFK